MSFKADFNLFIGGKTGILKGVKVSQEQIIVKNLINVKNLTSSSEITALSWGNADQSDVLIGTKEQTVKVFDSEFKSFSSSMPTKFGSGPIVGITRFNDVITTCSASGHIRVWKYNKEKAIELVTNGLCEKMEGTEINSGIVSTGGRSNDLKLWDLNTCERIFNAQNVRPNELDLQVPVWVSDMKILPQTSYKIAICSRYGHVRLYDTAAQRRPVIDFHLKDQSLQCIALGHREQQAVVGSGTGYMLLIDFRMASGNKVVGSFRGATGSIRQVACHPSKPYLASVGLDSYFRLHNIETRKCLKQQFMQVKLNSVLMRSDFELIDDEEPPNVPIVQESEASKEMDGMFDKMETIGAAKRPRRSKT